MLTVLTVATVHNYWQSLLNSPHYIGINVGAFLKGYFKCLVSMVATLAEKPALDIRWLQRVSGSLRCPA